MGPSVVLLGNDNSQGRREVEELGMTPGLRFYCTRRYVGRTLSENLSRYRRSLHMSLHAVRRWIVFFSAIVVGMAMSQVAQSQNAPLPERGVPSADR